MGQKVNPIVLRLGYIENWRSLWYADKKEYALNVVEDYKIREFIKKRFIQAAVSKVVIERLAEKIKIIIYTARPGVIIGRRGADIDKLRTELGKISAREITIDPREIKNPMVEAKLVAQNIAFQLEKRIVFRRAMKRAIDSAMDSGAKGIKVTCSGRLNGVEMSRKETFGQGKLPLHTFRAQIDFGFAEAHTTYGVLGVKVWINKGEIIKEIKRQDTGLTPKFASSKAGNDPAKGAGIALKEKSDQQVKVKEAETAPKEKMDGQAKGILPDPKE